MAYNDYDDDVSCFILESKLTNINGYEKWNLIVRIRLYMIRLKEKLLRLSKSLTYPLRFLVCLIHFAEQNHKNGDNWLNKSRTATDMDGTLPH